MQFKSSPASGPYVTFRPGSLTGTLVVIAKPGPAAQNGHFGIFQCHNVSVKTLRTSFAFSSVFLIFAAKMYII